MASSPIVVVPIAEQHIEGFAAAVGAVAREQRFLAVTDAFPMAMTRDFVMSNIANGLPHFVALDQGAVVGWCDIASKQRDVMQHVGVLGTGIIEGHRGKGLGTELMRAALAAARTKGLKRIELEVRVDNERAIKLYQKFGCKVEGRLERLMLVDGQFIDCFAMALLY